MAFIQDCHPTLAYVGRGLVRNVKEKVWPRKPEKHIYVLWHLVFIGSGQLNVCWSLLQKQTWPVVSNHQTLMRDRLELIWSEELDQQSCPDGSRGCSNQPNIPKLHSAERFPPISHRVLDFSCWMQHTAVFSPDSCIAGDSYHSFLHNTFNLILTVQISALPIMQWKITVKDNIFVSTNQLPNEYGLKPTFWSRCLSPKRCSIKSVLISYLHSVILKPLYTLHSSLSKPMFWSGSPFIISALNNQLWLLLTIRALLWFLDTDL